MNPLISIIIPTFNRYELLGETLDSVICQSFENWECLIIDDSSTDYTRELMEFYTEKDKRILSFSRPGNKIKGANSCRNYGFELSKGKFINWFDSDDLMHPDFLKIKIESLKNNECICCITNIQKFYQTLGKKEYGKILEIKYHNLFEDLIMQKIAIPTHNPMWRRDFLLSQELFDEELLQSQDLDFHGKIFHRFTDVKIINKTLLFMRTGHDSITSDFYKNQPLYLYSFLKVRENLVNLSGQNCKLNNYLIKQVLGVFRFMLSLKHYNECDALLRFIKINSLDQSLRFKRSFYKIVLYYRIFRFVGKGETRFKNKLYFP